MIVLFVDNLFFYLGGQSVSCKASLAALRLYGYFCDIVVMMSLSENKYDDDEPQHSVLQRLIGVTKFLRITPNGDQTMGYRDYVIN